MMELRAAMAPWAPNIQPLQPFRADSAYSDWHNYLYYWYTHVTRLEAAGGIAVGGNRMWTSKSFFLIYPQTVTLYQTGDSVCLDELRDSPFYNYFNNFLDALDGVGITQKSSGWP
jgi:hypothetical protein